MQKITPNLWFDDQAEAAAEFYVSCSRTRASSPSRITPMYWERLSEGGEEGPCGWVKDRYGLSWQVVPTEIEAIFRDSDPQRADRTMRAMLGMTKLDIAALRNAADGVPAG